jgi:hypothetical protein
MSSRALHCGEAAFFELLVRVMLDWERRKQKLEKAMA